MEVKMNNNDILIRLRYALDIKDTDIIKSIPKSLTFLGWIFII